MHVSIAKNVVPSTLALPMSGRPNFEKATWQVATLLVVALYIIPYFTKFGSITQTNNKTQHKYTEQSKTK